VKAGDNFIPGLPFSRQELDHFALDLFRPLTLWTVVRECCATREIHSESSNSILYWGPENRRSIFRANYAHIEARSGFQLSEIIVIEKIRISTSFALSVPLTRNAIPWVAVARH
jgi:hypothetical protein